LLPALASHEVLRACLREELGVELEAAAQGRGGEALVHGEHFDHALWPGFEREEQPALLVRAVLLAELLLLAQLHAGALFTRAAAAFEGFLEHAAAGSNPYLDGGARERIAAWVEDPQAEFALLLFGREEGRWRGVGLAAGLDLPSLGSLLVRRSALAAEAGFDRVGLAFDRGAGVERILGVRQQAQLELFASLCLARKRTGPPAAADEEGQRGKTREGETEEEKSAHRGESP
jgi:hypothetical protein